MYRLVVKIFNRHGSAFVAAFLLASVFLASKNKLVMWTGILIMLSFITLVFLGGISYFWKMKELNKFIRYTWTKHRGALLMLLGVLTTGVILSIVDIANCYKGGAVTATIILTALFSALFYFDYKNHGQ